ncbi:hypothetical protein K8R43_02480 [archaeon]|nr:hypothetical protein [archaeon]
MEEELKYAGGAFWFLAFGTLSIFLFHETRLCTVGTLCGPDFFTSNWFIIIAFFVLIGLGLIVEGTKK